MRYSMINCLILSFLSIETLYSQVEIVSVYPTQNYLTAPRETDLYAVFNLDLDESTVVDTNIVVFAERTGTHFGTLSYDANSKTLTFDPDNDFIAGERVRVTLTNRITGASGESFRGFTWHFTVRTWGDDRFEFVYRGEEPAGASFYLNSADFNNDGYPDIVAIQDIYYQRIYLYLNDQAGGFYYYGTILETEGGLLNPQLVDVDRDGNVDIYIPGSQIFLMNQANGEFLPIYLDLLSVTWDYGAVADFDNDGYLDLAISSHGVDTLYVYRGLKDIQFELRHSYPLPRTASFRTSTEEVFDLNSDGLVDILSSLLGYAIDSVVVLLNSGQFIFTGPNIYNPGLATSSDKQYTNDIDGDGDVDYVFFGSTRSDFYRFFLYNDGEGRFTFGNYIPPLRAIRTVFGGDIDGDGDIDLVTDSLKVISVMPWITEGYLYFLRNDGPDTFRTVGNYQVGESMEQKILLDYDLDGDLDIVGIRFGYYLFWMENTADLSVKDDGRRELIRTFNLFTNYPNPFNRSTTVAYEIRERTEVSLMIYDIRGRQVRTLVHQIQGAGHYELPWDATDDMGREVSSGIYLIHLRAGDFVKTKKMLLLR